MILPPLPRAGAAAVAAAVPFLAAPALAAPFQHPAPGHGSAPARDPGPVAGAPDDLRGSLAGHFAEPDAYLEIFDFAALGSDVARAPLGRLMGDLDLLPTLGVDASGREQSVVLHPFAGLAEGLDLWEALVRQLVERVGADHLGLEPDQVERIAHAGGGRLSYAFVVGEPWEDRPPSWAMGWSLRPGGAEVLAADLMPAFERLAEGSERTSLRTEPDAPGAACSYRLEGPGVGTTWLVLRDGLLAWTADEGLGQQLRRAPSSPTGTPFHAARRAALAAGQSLWVWGHAPALTRRLAFDDDDARSLLCALGLNDFGDVALGLGERDGQLVSWMELRREGRSGLHGLVRAAPAAWRSLGALTADTLLVLGMPRSARDVANELTELALWADPDVYRDLRRHWRAMEDVPGLGAALAPGALGPEFVLFARPTLSPRPLVYLAAPLGPALAAELERHEAAADLADGDVHLEGGGATVVCDVHAGASFWIARHDAFDHVAWTRVGDLLVLAEDARSMKAYLNARQRERLADREAAIASVWKGLQGCFAGRGDDGAYERTGLFVHTRSGQVVERLWPLALLGLRMEIGAAADGLPTAPEIAGEVGESTVVVLDRPGALEWRGRGLLGGLLLLF